MLVEESPPHPAPSSITQSSPPYDVRHKAATGPASVSVNRLRVNSGGIGGSVGDSGRKYPGCCGNHVDIHDAAAFVVLQKPIPLQTTYVKN